MLHEPVLKAEFQWPHITRRDQFPRFHTEVGLDLLHNLAVLHDANSPCSTESPAVSPEGGSGEPQPQATACGQLLKGLAPGCG